MQFSTLPQWPLFVWCWSPGYILHKSSKQASIISGQSEHQTYPMQVKMPLIVKLIDCSAVVGCLSEYILGRNPQKNPYNFISWSGSIPGWMLGCHSPRTKNPSTICVCLKSDKPKGTGRGRYNLATILDCSVVLLQASHNHQWDFAPAQRIQLFPEHWERHPSNAWPAAEECSLTGSKPMEVIENFKGSIQEVLGPGHWHVHSEVNPTDPGRLLK